jgi:hypothetical protein
MIDTILQKLIDFIQQASPVIWGAYYRQVYVDAGTLIVCGVVSLISAIFFIKKGGQWIKKNDCQFNGYEMWYAVGALALFIAVIFFVIGGRQLSNPIYYAIQNIIATIR